MAGQRTVRRTLDVDRYGLSSSYPGRVAIVEIGNDVRRIRFGVHLDDGVVRRNKIDRERQMIPAGGAQEGGTGHCRVDEAAT